MKPLASSTAAAGIFTVHAGRWVAGHGGPVVVLLHASLGSKSQWTALTERLSRRFRVIALDLVGYGDNTGAPAPRPFTLDDEVRLVTAQLRDIAPAQTRVHLVGHSYGGLVALRLAHAHPDRVASLCLYEPVVFRLLDAMMLRDAQALAVRVAREVAAGMPELAVRRFVDFWSADGAFDRLPLHARVSLAKRASKIPLDFEAAHAWPARSSDVRAIAAPTLVMVGSRAPAVARQASERLAQLLPDVRVARFELGHMGPASDPDQVNPWIEAFVEACSAGQPPATSRAGVSAGVPIEVMP